jgi:LDH2 family malate/lactate/ureidoglycolate dehydrogenase
VTTVAIDQLRDALEARGRALGFSHDRAERLADHYLDAEMRGARGHGAERMRWLYGFDDLRPDAEPRLVDRTDGLARWHAAGALGYVALAEVLAAELADPPAGARLVAISDCFPTGRLGYFAEAGAATGLLTLVTATSTPRIVHPHGGPPLLGTNPLCLGLPGNPPTVIDVSMGAVTYGAVIKAAATGSPLPDGSALRADGSPTLDPHDVIENRAGIAPFGDVLSHKGFALALLVETLCAALAGTDGHAVAVLLARPQADPMDELRRQFEGRHVPGDSGLGRLAAARAAGSVELPDDLWAWLQSG